MKYIITGGAGFIGSYLTELLISRHKQVLVIDNLSTGFRENLQTVDHHPLFRFIYGDVGDLTTWINVLEPTDVIIHLAGTVGVTKVCEDPLHTVTNNSSSSGIILHQALTYGCKVFLASTSEIYGNSPHGISSEENPAQVLMSGSGRSAYVLGKLMTEYYGLHYYHQYDLPVIIGRFFNTIGIRQTSHFGMVVPTFINQALHNAPIEVYGDGSQQRSFCDVHDVAIAILLLLEHEEATGHIFNIGSTDPISILSLANYIKQATGSGSDILFLPFPPERTDGHDIRNRKPSIDKLYAATGWQPKTTWQESVSAIIHSYKTINAHVCGKRY